MSAGSSSPSMSMGTCLPMPFTDASPLCVYSPIFCKSSVDLDDHLLFLAMPLGTASIVITNVALFFGGHSALQLEIYI
jgi:hypothetical protein